jgi:hypothetical protein
LTPEEGRNVIVTQIKIDARPIANTKSYYFENARGEFCMWEFDPNWAKGLKDDDEDYKKLANGTLLIQTSKPWDSLFKEEPKEYPTDVISSIKECDNDREVFNYRTDYAAAPDGTTMYHIILPEYCYCVPKFILKNEDDPIKIVH